jgi:hypothetical protein
MMGYQELLQAGQRRLSEEVRQAEARLRIAESAPPTAIADPLHHAQLQVHECKDMFGML